MPDLYSKDLSVLSQGLLSNGPAIVSLGLPVELGPIPATPRDVRVVTTADQVRPGMGEVVLTSESMPIRDLSGVIIPPSMFGELDLGSGVSLGFDASTLGGRVSGPGSGLGPLRNLYDSGITTYTGSDCRVLIELSDNPMGAARCYKQLLELTTLTVSVHRVKSPVPAAGFINTKGFSRGRRTIAGTLVLTKFSTEVLGKFLQADFVRERSKDSDYTKIDQLPSFNLTILFADEWGHASYQRLLRVEFVTDGSVYSIQDMLSEQTISYLAADFTPLLPLTLSSVFAPTSTDAMLRRDRVPSDLWRTVS